MISVETKVIVQILSKLEKNVFEEVRSVVDKWAKIIETKAKDDAPTDRGKLKASINQALYLKATEVLGVVGTNSYYGFLQHEGFKAHWVPFYNPPTWSSDSGIRYYDMLVWAKRHGFPVDGVKGADGKWIKKPMKGIWVHGTAHPFIKEAFDKYAPLFEEELKVVLGKAVSKLNE